jgi:hypothetical protein
LPTVAFRLQNNIHLAERQRTTPQAKPPKQQRDAAVLWALQAQSFARR